MSHHHWSTPLVETVKTQGFTFIELLVGLAIVVILTAVAVPTFITLYQKYHITTTIQNLYYVLQYARSEAVKNNTTVYAHFQTGDTWCYGTRVGASCNCSTANSCTLANYSASRPQDISLTTAGVTNGLITFDGSRGATNTTSTITFTLYGQTISISLKINPLGNMQICSSTISGYPACT